MFGNLDRAPRAPYELIHVMFRSCLGSPARVLPSLTWYRVVGQWLCCRVGGAGLGYLPAGPSITWQGRPAGQARIGATMRYACSICLRGEPPAVRCTILALFGSLLFHPKNTHPLTTHMTRDHDAIATHDHPPPMALLPETRVPFDWGFQRL